MIIADKLGCLCHCVNSLILFWAFLFLGSRTMKLWTANYGAPSWVPCWISCRKPFLWAVKFFLLSHLLYILLKWVEDNLRRLSSMLLRYIWKISCFLLLYNWFLLLLLLYLSLEDVFYNFGRNLFLSCSALLYNFVLYDWLWDVLLKHWPQVFHRLWLSRIFKR